MKKIQSILQRKHGYRARAALIERRLCLQYQTETHQPCQTAARLKTVVRFESDNNSYLWTTDRGRTKLIKH